MGIGDHPEPRGLVGQPRRFRELSLPGSEQRQALLGSAHLPLELGDPHALLTDERLKGGYSKHRDDHEHHEAHR